MHVFFVNILIFEGHTFRASPLLYREVTLFKNDVKEFVSELGNPKETDGDDGFNEAPLVEINSLHIEFFNPSFESFVLEILIIGSILIFHG